MESKVLYQWLKTHPLINLNGLCKIVKFDRANLIKNMKSGKELKPEILNKFWLILADYGFLKIVKQYGSIQKLEVKVTDLNLQPPKSNYTINTTTPAFKNKIEQMMWEDEQEQLKLKKK